MTEKQALILPFDRIRATALPLVGGKGANLGEMTHAGFPVPPGFCLTTEAFQQFIDSCPEMDALYVSLDTVTGDDLNQARSIGQTVRETLKDVAIPQSILDEISHYWHNQDGDFAYAVRSSATAEDLPDASFAGQQDTYLNIMSLDALQDAVRNCWISLFTDRAILYRVQNHFPHRDVKLSVVVQQMVMSEKSGILFTADPLTGHRHTLAIDASFGLGEALVSGIVSPDSYRVDKRDMTIIEREIADKKVAIFPEKDGGVRRENLTEPQRSQTVLDDTQILELADLGKRIEAHYGIPQDIEWAIADSKLYLLQTRPITSLFPVPQPRIKSDAERIYFSLSHFQVLTEPISPMGLSIWQLMIPFGRENPIAGENPYIMTAGGRMYADMSALVYTPFGRKAIPNGLMVVDELVGLALKQFISREAYAVNKPDVQDKAKFTSVFRLIGSVVRDGMKRLWFKPTDHVLEDLNAHIEGAIARAKLTSESDDLRTRVHAVYEHIQGAFFKEAFSIFPLIVVIMSSSTLLKKLLGAYADPADLAAIQSGLEGNVTTEMDLQVGDLADIARENEAIVAAFEEEDTAKLLSRIRQAPGSERFLEALEQFLQTYGLRGPGEIDVARTRWMDNPTQLLLVMRGNLQNPEPGSHRKHYAGLIEKAENAIPRLIEVARNAPMGWLRARIVRRLLTVFRAYMPIREHPKFMLIHFFQNVREVMQETAIELKTRGQIDDVEDIWYLTLPEAVEVLDKTRQDVKPIIAQRRLDYVHYATLTPPRVMTSNGEIITATRSLENLPEGAIPGSPVSAGVVEGIVRVMLDPAGETLHPGEILVAPSTDPAWTPLFINAAGVILEVGGLMTHGSVVAREYGIPAVVGVLDATRILKTGQRVRIDGNRGIIEVL